MRSGIMVRAGENGVLFRRARCKQNRSSEDEKDLSLNHEWLIWITGLNAITAKIFYFL